MLDEKAHPSNDSPESPVVAFLVARVVVVVVVAVVVVDADDAADDVAVAVAVVEVDVSCPWKVILRERSWWTRSVSVISAWSGDDPQRNRWVVRPCPTNYPYSRWE